MTQVKKKSKLVITKNDPVVEPEVKKESVSHGTSNCVCGHTKEIHYGGEKDYCNTLDCQCSAYSKR